MLENNTLRRRRRRAKKDKQMQMLIGGCVLAVAFLVATITILVSEQNSQPLNYEIVKENRFGEQYIVIGIYSQRDKNLTKEIIKECESKYRHILILTIYFYDKRDVIPDHIDSWEPEEIKSNFAYFSRRNDSDFREFKWNP